MATASNIQSVQQFDKFDDAMRYSKDMAGPGVTPKLKRRPDGGFLVELPMAPIKPKAQPVEVVSGTPTFKTRWFNEANKPDAEAKAIEFSQQFGHCGILLRNGKLGVVHAAQMSRYTPAIFREFKQGAEVTPLSVTPKHIEDRTARYDYQHKVGQPVPHRSTVQADLTATEALVIGESIRHMEVEANDFDQRIREIQRTERKKVPPMTNKERFRHQAQGLFPFPYFDALDRWARGSKQRNGTTTPGYILKLDIGDSIFYCKHPTRGDHWGFVNRQPDDVSTIQVRLIRTPPQSDLDVGYEVHDMKVPDEVPFWQVEYRDPATHDSTGTIIRARTAENAMKAILNHSPNMHIEDVAEVTAEWASAAPYDTIESFLADDRDAEIDEDTEQDPRTIAYHQRKAEQEANNLLAKTG